jgi:hypothetical protein
MKSNVRRRALAALVGAGALTGAILGWPSATAHADSLAFNLNIVGGFGGEPSIVSDPSGILYDSSPSDGLHPHISLDKGATWAFTSVADQFSGDTCLATDQVVNTVYACNLAGSTSVTPLDADVWRSTDQGAHWTEAVNQITEDQTCGTSCSLFGVDRQWTAASVLSPTPPGYTGAEVVLMYHDFYGPSSIWVNISKDGGQTFGPQQNVLASLNPGTAGPNSLAAEGYTFCSTIPGGVGIVPNGKPHAGRIIVAWMAEDPINDGTGCNLTMAGAFHTLWVSYSDNNGATWTAQQAFDAGIGHDASTPFMAVNFDNDGNPYLGFAAPAPNMNPVTCGTESAAGMVQSDQTCAYKMQVVWSADQGATWHHGSDGGGLITGSAGSAYIVNSSQTGESVFPTIAAAQPGQVDVGWLQTENGEIDPTDAIGKFEPLGCDKNDTPNGQPVNPLYPDRCHWDLFAGQSVNLLGTPGSETWTTAKLTPAPMHFGDICNLGIACPLPIGIPRDPRDLLDFNEETIDPTTGCAHIAYADDNFGTNYGDPNDESPFGNHLMSANQTSGCLALQTPIPESPWTFLFVPAAAIAGAAGLLARRRRRVA